MLYFDKVQEKDTELYNLILEEYNRQNSEIELIASENVPSEAVLQAQASYHTLKYAEGYPGARYYGGCNVIDKTEQLAIDRACKLFNCHYANVQPHSGANANTAIQFALCKPGDTIIGMSLNSGGHLTHGAKPTFSGKYFKVIQYDVDINSYLIDYDVIKSMLYEHKPRLFIAGASAYPREIDFKKIKEIIDEYNKQNEARIMADTYLLETDIPKVIEREHCYFMVDMAHIAGLVAAGLHQSPIPYADVVTSTTHKTLRGPRGGLILTDKEDLIKKINKAVFPGVQGGPLENIIAAKAVCFWEALQPEFKEYQKQVVENAKYLAYHLQKFGIKVLTGGTDNHLLLLDLRDSCVTGKELEERLESIGIISNKNAIPFDTQNKTTTSGLRLGTAAITSRGLKKEDILIIAAIIASCVVPEDEFEWQKEAMQKNVAEIANKYPLYN